MERYSRDDLLIMIANLTNLYESNVACISTLDGILTNALLDDETTTTLLAEKKSCEDDNSELNKDIAMYEEELHIIDMNASTDERSSSQYEDRYDGLGEVFTGGDY